MTVPDLRLEPIAESRLKPLDDLLTLPFSSLCSDHMLVCEYRDGTWQSATVRPYGPLSLPPSISAVQYGVSVFEGLKAHRTPAGKIAVFRPRDNARRLNRSAARLAMPDVPEDLFVGGLRALVRLDESWVPAHGQGALYIRPCLFSTDESIRVKPADRFLFVIFTFPFGTYYAAPVDVLATDEYVRAFPGGTGDVKPAGNYAPTLLADRQAQQAGYQTVMWLDGRERRYVEECGVMNVFFVLSGDRVITPSLGGTILPGITRDSVLTLLREMGLGVEERRISIDEVLEASAAGQLLECFGTGTAATLSHVRRIRYRDRILDVPPLEARKVGPAVKDRLIRIATGVLPDTYGWLDVIEREPARATA
jgi:branched-chain amino acid aminotransferase